MARPAKKVIETVIEPIIEGPQQPIETVYNQEINLADDQYLFNGKDDAKAIFKVGQVKLVNCIVYVSPDRSEPVISIFTQDVSSCIDNLIVQPR